MACRTRMHEPAQLLRHHLTLAALLDLAVVCSWLAAVILQVRARVYVVLGLFTLVAGGFTIVRQTAYYAPPVQQTLDLTSPADFARQHGLKPAPQGTILRDIAPGDEDSGHWTNEHPTVQFTPGTSQGWSFYARFWTVGDVLKVTGPQIIQFTVNGVTLGTKMFSDAGEHEFRRTIEPAFIHAGVPNTAGMDIEPILIMRDGAHLGVVLISMGFVEELEK